MSDLLHSDEIQMCIIQEMSRSEHDKRGQSHNLKILAIQRHSHSIDWMAVGIGNIFGDLSAKRKKEPTFLATAIPWKDIHCRNVDIFWRSPSCLLEDHVNMVFGNVQLIGDPHPDCIVQPEIHLELDG